MPPRIAYVLSVLAILTEYGRHLLCTVESRACRPGFATIAQFFGTARVETILAHLTRGVMRALALQRLLTARAKTGRDLAVRQRRVTIYNLTGTGDETGDEDETGDGAGGIAPIASAAATAPQRLTTPRRPASQEPLTEANLPNMRQIEAEVRRRPIGRTLVAIALDFGLAPLLCEPKFGTALFDLFQKHGGSFEKYFVEIRRREAHFERHVLDRNPGMDPPAQTGDAIKKVLGFFAGETAIDPLDPPSRRAPLLVIAQKPIPPPLVGLGREADQG